MRKLQFQNDNKKHGLTKVKGFAWSTQEGLMFEYQVSDNILDLLKSKVKEALIPYAGIESVVYKKAWHSKATVCIVLNSLNNDKLPFVNDAEINLRFKRNQRDNGKEFAVNAQLELSNFRLAELDGL